MQQFEPHQPGSSILLTLKAINDFNETEYGKVTVQLFDERGKSVWSQVQSVSISPYREKNYPVVVDLPNIAGGYTLVTEFEGELNPVKKQISRRYINVGKRGNQFYEIKP
jgi:hypothetical protein